MSDKTIGLLVLGAAVVYMIFGNQSVAPPDWTDEQQLASDVNGYEYYKPTDLQVQTCAQQLSLLYRVGNGQ